MYRQDILDEAKHPRHEGKIRHADRVLSASNPTCGDEITLYLKLDHGGRFISHVRFEGRGCLVMRASASRFTDALFGKTLAEARRMSEKDALAVFGAPLTPSRESCALLPYRALQALWKNGLDNASNRKQQKRRKSVKRKGT